MDLCMSRCRSIKPLDLKVATIGRTSRGSSPIFGHSWNNGFESVEPLHRLRARAYAVGSSRNSRPVADHEPGLDALAIASIGVEHRGGRMESRLLIGPQSTAIALRSHKRNGRRAAVPKQVATHEVNRP